MPVDCDLLILGGGCAGLSLASRLCEYPGGCARTLVVESRPRYTNDRTWCFWKQSADYFAHLATHAWRSLQLRSGTRTVSFACGNAPYQMLPAAAFYSEACGLIEPSPAVDLLLGVSVTVEPRRCGKVWKVETDQGVLVARQVIDTRPPGRCSLPGATLWQSFAGQEVVCKSGSFDPGTAMLMDFTEASNEGVHFSYVLPITRERALIESTVFAPQPLSAQLFTERQASALARECRGASFHVVRSEYGVLPMGIASPRVSAAAAGLVQVGVMRGAARPATGYAFGRIQRWADECVSALREGRPALVHRQDPLCTRLMDGLFLNVLRTRPELAPRLFLDLFEKVEPARLIRFLSDAGSLADHAAIIAALPAGPFLQALVDPRARSSLLRAGAA